MQPDNKYLTEFAKTLKQRFNIDADDMSLCDWLCHNTKLRGRKFSVDKYPFQRALIDDHSRSSVTIKPSQVGVSEIYQRVALALLARNRHRKGIYAYPDDDMRKKNVQTRVMPMAETEKPFAPREGDKWVRSIGLIQLGTSVLYMTGSKVGDATSTDADFVFEDEYDLHNMEIAALFSSRLQNSDWKYERYFSTPTFTEFGVDALYRQSDQQSYLIKCDHCNHWQFPLFDTKFIHIPGLPSDWPDLLELDVDKVDHYGMDLGAAYVRCEKCLHRLDLGREDNRAWVAKYPSRQTMKGWKINPFSVSTRPVIDIVSDLFKYKTRDFIRGFKNSVIGEPEDSSSARISSSDIQMCMGSPSIPSDLDKDMPTWIGCDMGHTCTLTVGQGENPKKVRGIHMEQVPLARLRERIKEIQNTYNLVAGMVDRHPESQVAADIWEDTGGIVVPCEYRGDKEMNLVMVPGDDEKVLYVQVNRTLHLDQVARAIRNKYLQMNGYGLLGSEIPVQLRNMVRMEEPEKPAVWNKLNPNDHFFHSLGFMYSAMKLKPYEEIKIGPTLSTLGFLTANRMTGQDNFIGASKRILETLY
jgi:hypothetical protein